MVSAPRQFKIQNNQIKQFRFARQRKRTRRQVQRNIGLQKHESPAGQEERPDQRAPRESARQRRRLPQRVNTRKIHFFRLSTLVSYCLAVIFLYN